MQVLIVGSANHLCPDGEADEFHRACREIGVALAQAGHDLVVGPDKENTAEESVVRGFAESAVEECVTLFLDSADKAAAIKTIAAEHKGLQLRLERTKGPWVAGRVAKILRSDCVVTIGGTEGTSQIGHIAPALQRPVLAIGCFGGSSENLWVEYEQYYVPLGERDARIYQLSDHWGQGCASLVVEALERLVEERLFRFQYPPHHPFSAPSGRRIFVVHGHDHALKDSLVEFLNHLDLQPIVLSDQPKLGRTIIESFEDYSDVAYAVVLLTADDVGAKKDSSTLRSRARQNCILEMGYFIGNLGRRRVAAIVDSEVEKPSDIEGILYINANTDRWKHDLEQEMKAAGVRLSRPAHRRKSAADPTGGAS